MRKDLLPIGTVVLLKGGTKKVMITGYSSTAEENSDTIYDYNGCVFPEGFMHNIFCLFNNEEIDEVFYRGLENDESKDYIGDIKSQLFGSSSKGYQEPSREGTKTGAVETKKIGRTPKAPTNPMSASEMLSKYGVKQTSSDGNYLK